MSAPVVRKDLGLGVEVVRRTVYEDQRGHFSELWNTRTFKQAELDFTIQQTSLSFSHAGVLRGLHFQFPYQQKLVTVVSGETFTVAVDIRPDSPTRGQFVTRRLTAEAPDSLVLPAGFAHGFLALKDTVLCYHCDQVHQSESEFTLLWSDPHLAIPWPLQAEPILSERDATAQPLSALNFSPVEQV